MTGNWFTCNHHTTLSEDVVKMSVCFLRDSKCTLSPKFLFSCGWRILPWFRPWRKGECSESRMSYITETTDVNMQNTQFWILSLIPLRKRSNDENLFGVFCLFWDRNILKSFFTSCTATYRQRFSSTDTRHYNNISKLNSSVAVKLVTESFRYRAD